MKTNKGLIHLMDEMAHEVRYDTNIRFNELKSFLESTIEKKPREFVYWGGQDTTDLMEAHLKGDKAKIKEINDRIQKEQKERLDRLYARIMDKYGDGVFNTFEELDKLYKRKDSLDDRHEWEISNEYLDEEDEWDSVAYYVTIHKGLFNVFKILSDETGWFTEYEYYANGINYDEVFDAIPRV